MDRVTSTRSVRTGLRDRVRASVLIAYLDEQDDLHAAAEGLLVAAIDEDFGANSLTLVELLVGPARADRIDDALDPRIRQESPLFSRLPACVSCR
jgi:hypothetical protein